MGRPELSAELQSLTVTRSKHEYLGWVRLVVFDFRSYKGPAASGPHQGRLTWEEQYDLMDAEGTFSNAEVARARARGLWKCTTVEDGLIVKRDYCKGASWARTSCLHCNQPFWKDCAQPGSVCRSCVGVTDKACRQRRMQRRVAFLMSSRCGAECDLSRLPADVLRHIGEMVQ